MTGLNVEFEGAVDKPALLLVHGILSSNLQWQPNRAALSERFRVITAELWGHGGSPAPRDPSRYEVASYTREFETLRERLGIDSWFVCGQSFGAGIAIRYALARPGAVRGLVLTNSRSALHDVREPSRSSQLPGGLAAWESMDLRALPFHPCHARRFPEGLKAQMVEVADRVDPYGLWQAIQTTSREVSCREEAAQIAVPTLLVNGRYEKAFQADRDYAVATIPGLEIADLEGGHSINIEAAAGFDAALIGFAQRI